MGDMSAHMIHLASFEPIIASSGSTQSMREFTLADDQCKLTTSFSTPVLGGACSDIRAFTFLPEIGHEKQHFNNLENKFTKLGSPALNKYEIKLLARMQN